MKQTFSLTLLFFLFACNFEKEKMQAQLNLQHGFELYQERCANCHQIDGSGLARLIPPLKNSDYLKNNLAELPLIITQGLKKQITVNGINYTLPMPADSGLNQDELLAICNFVSIKFVNNDSIYTAEQIAKLNLKLKP